MDIERLISQLTREILGHLQAAEQGNNLLVLTRRSSCEQLRLPEELRGQRLFCIDDSPPPQAIARRILPRLELEQQADLAVGRAGDPLSRAVLNALLDGHRVEVLEYAYRDFASSAPPALFRLYREQAEKLTEFGLKPYVAVKKAEVPSGCRQLITEADIRSLLSEGKRSLKIDKTWLITPLALDLARDNQLCIEREDKQSC
jgi:hypothetical protein